MRCSPFGEALITFGSSAADPCWKTKDWRILYPLQQRETRI